VLNRHRIHQFLGSDLADSQWKNLGAIGMVRSKVTEKGVEREETRYAVRAHWALKTACIGVWMSRFVRIIAPKILRSFDILH